MAFRAPQQRPQQVRQQSHQHTEPPPAPQQQRKRPLEESQDWILFAPPSQTTSQTPRTADLSRASYFGSLETGVRSDLLGSDDHIIRQVTAANDDDGTELDSLDDGLHDFHTDPSQRLDQSGGAVLPTHDGLGSFPTGFGNADALQEQLWQHERYNPQRRHIHRRLSSVQRRLDALEDDNTAPELDPQEERRLRVERWRTEQSKAVLEEIEKETRRRYKRAQRDTSASQMRLGSSAPGPAASVVTGFDSVSTETSEPGKSETDSFWRRITRRVIRDLIGLDDNTLSVIFGEELPETLSSTPTPSSPLEEVAFSSADKTWENKLMERVARELNILVYQLSELESAFSTYSSRLPPPSAPALRRRTSSDSRPHPRPLPADLEASMQNIFRPTLARTPLPGPDASLWGIEEEPAAEDGTHEDADYWERDPSLKMLFSYLRRRMRIFSSSSSSTTTTAAASPTADDFPGPLPAEWATGASALGTSPASQRRADLIRRNHPLVSRAAERNRRDPSVVGDAGAAAATSSAIAAAVAGHRQELLGAALALHRRRGSSGCGASQSATNKRSRRSSGTGQSRKYWDFAGGSVDGSGVSSAGAAAAAAGGAGGWGEV